MKTITAMEKEQVAACRWWMNSDSMTLYFGMKTKGLSSGLTIEQLRTLIDCQARDFPSMRESDTLSTSMSVSVRHHF